MVSVCWVEDVDLGYAALVIHDEESGDTIEFQRSLQLDPHDRALGMDTYCLVRGGATHYGGVEEYSAIQGTVSLSLSESAARTLELSRILHIEIDPKGMDVFKRYIHDILK